MASEQELKLRMEAIETLVQELDSHPDPVWRSKARDLVSAILEMHREALDRILDEVGATDGPQRARFSSDELISSVLLLHGLHPVPMEQRVMGALEKVRPVLSSHGGDVELIDIESGTVRVRLLGACTGCPSSEKTLRSVVESAIVEAAPDLRHLELSVEGQPL